MKKRNLLLHRLIYKLLSPFPAYQRSYKRNVMEHRTYVSKIGRVEILFHGALGLPHLMDINKQPVLWLSGTVMQPTELQGAQAQVSFYSSEKLKGTPFEGELGRCMISSLGDTQDETSLSIDIYDNKEDELRELAAKQLVAGWPIYSSMAFEALNDSIAESFNTLPNCPMANVEYTEAKVLGKITEISRKPEELIQ